MTYYCSGFRGRGSPHLGCGETFWTRRGAQRHADQYNHTLAKFQGHLGVYEFYDSIRPTNPPPPPPVPNWYEEDLAG